MNYLFDKNWFQKYQRKLLWLLRFRLFKYILRIETDKEIIGILPNAYFIKDNKENEFIADFRTHNKYSKRLFYAFYPLWYLFHFLDWIILDKELFPQLNVSIRNKLVSMSLATTSISKVKNAVAFSAKIKPVGNISKVFSRFINQLDIFIFAAFFTKLRNALSSSYSIVKSRIANFIPLPIHILFSESPDIFLPSNPGFMTYSAFITNKTFRNLYFGVKRLFEIFFSPYKIARARTILSIDFVRVNAERFITNVTYKLLHILSINLSLNFATLTVYPDAGTGATTVDGAVYYGGSSSWATTRDATAGTVVQQTEASNWNPLTSLGGDGNYTVFRSFFLFDTSALGAGAVISAAVLSFFATGQASSNTNTTDIRIVSSTPASNNILVVGDYSKIGSTSFASKTIANWVSTDGTENTFTLDANGRDNISKIGISKFATRIGRDIDNSAPTGENRTYSYYADQAGTNLDPKLVVTYTLPATDKFFLMFN